MAKSGTERSTLLKAMDILFGIVVMGTVGTLIGMIAGGGIMPLASGAGLVLGGFILSPALWLYGRTLRRRVPQEAQVATAEL